MKFLKFFTIKRIIIFLIVALIVVAGWYFIFGRKNNSSSIQTAMVSKQDLKETVLATGQVVSGTDLKLSFQGSGKIKQIFVAEGDKVKTGQTLAVLDGASAEANLTSAKGSLAEVQANYEKLLAGASPEDIKVAEDSVAEAQQELDSAYTGSVNILNDAYTKIYNSLTSVTAIQNTYFGAADQQGIEVSDSGKNISADSDNVKSYLTTVKSNSSPQNIETAVSETIAALNNTFDSLNVVRAMCDQGIYYSKVSAADRISLDTQKANINLALTSVTNAQQAIQSDKIVLQKAKNQLASETASPRQADIDASKAQILSSQGQVDLAETALNNLTLKAPADGTITSVDAKVGEQATALENIIVLQNVDDLHAEANISEADIASLAVGQSIDYTFDALGPDQHFSGTILTINPASTIISGVVNYKVTGSLNNIPNIKPGMTANMTVLVAERSSALAIPSTAIVNKIDRQYVKVIDDSVTKTYHEVQIETGLKADGGLVEIVSGLKEGQEIITYIKQ